MYLDISSHNVMKLVLFPFDRQIHKVYIPSSATQSSKIAIGTK